jgi:hypothetical protein
MYKTHSLSLLLLFFGVLHAKEDRDFGGIEKFFPTNSDRDALESTQPIQLATPDGNLLRSIRPKGVVVDEAMSGTQEKTVTETPVESSLPVTPDSKPEATSSSSQEEEPRGEGRGTGVASTRQYYFNARQASPSSPQDGSHSKHHDKQMVLVFAHSGQYMRLSGGLNSPICHLYN